MELVSSHPLHYVHWQSWSVQVLDCTRRGGTPNVHLDGSTLGRSPGRCAYRAPSRWEHSPQKSWSLCAQSSISEGLPISILEAALCGLCVVCTHVGGCAELLAAPSTGEKDAPASFGRLVVRIPSGTYLSLVVWHRQPCLLLPG